MRRYVRSAKPLLYLAVLYLVVAWSLEASRGMLAFWLVAAPAAVE